MTRGKIVLTPFPFTDLTRNKVRPAVIISSPLTNNMDVIVAFISTVFDIRAEIFLGNRFNHF